MNPETIDRPLEDILAECTSLLGRMDDLLGGIEPLEPDEVRRTLKARRGGEASTQGHLPRIHALIRGSRLGVAGA